MRDFVACRDRGDGEGAQGAWNRLAGLSLDRIRALVDMRARRLGLSQTERDDAVSKALVRTWQKLAGTFAGDSMGEYVNALKRLVGFACFDVVRESTERHRREASFDTPTRDDDGSGDRRALDTEVARLGWHEIERAESRRDAHAFLDWALPRLDDRHRRLLEHDLEGYDAETTAGELGVTMGNLYQLRRRARLRLTTLLQEWDR